MDPTLIGKMLRLNKRVKLTDKAKIESLKEEEEMKSTRMFSILNLLVNHQLMPKVKEHYLARTTF